VRVSQFWGIVHVRVGLLYVIYLHCVPSVLWSDDVESRAFVYRKLVVCSALVWLAGYEFVVVGSCGGVGGWL